MTKDELKKEAEEFISKNWTPYDFYDTECNVYNDDIRDDLVRVYFDSAEPREKQIQIDAEQIRALQKDKGNLIDRVKELEAQIERMKNCPNCKYCNNCDYDVCKDCKGMNKWELAND